MFNPYKFRLPTLLIMALLLSVSITSCDDDPELDSSDFKYTIHNGQTVPSAAYAGSHATDFSVTIKVSEMENGKAMVRATLENTMDGQTYHIHSHDAADASSTPNGTPYLEAPNSDVLVQMVQGNGGTATASQESTMSYDELTSTYEGFFVVHDPLQDISTTDISTYLVVGSFARTQEANNYASTLFNYDFNTGQVAEAFAYDGAHPTSLSSSIQVDELANGSSRITIRHENTVDGEIYSTHAHDMADAASTPNGTPYIETPNAGVFAAGIAGNGGMAAATKISEMSYSEITTSYDGFFVVHDPLQAITTTDPTTYIVLGVFAR